MRWMMVNYTVLIRFIFKMNFIFDEILFIYLKSNK